MKLVVQRISKGKVTVQEKTVSEVGKGLFVLVGIGREDSKKDAEYLVEKLFKLRVMKDEEGKMNLAVKDVNGEFLVVSQFTLYANTKGGNRPSFVDAQDPEIAKPIYEHFVECLKNKGAVVKTGSFGNYMKIDVEIDGPVTILY